VHLRQHDVCTWADKEKIVKVEVSELAPLSELKMVCCEKLGVEQHKAQVRVLLHCRPLLGCVFRRPSGADM
jgi:hypothetical protein